MDEFGQPLEQGQTTGIFKMECATEHEQLWPRIIIVDNLIAPLRVIVQLDQARERRQWIIIERVRMTRGEEQHIAILHPDCCLLTFDLQISATPADDMEHAVLARGKFIAPARSQLPARREPTFQFKGIEYISEHIHRLSPHVSPLWTIRHRYRTLWHRTPPRTSV